MTNKIESDNNVGLPSKVNFDNPQGLYEGIEYREFWNGSQKHELNKLEHFIVRYLLPVSGRRIIDVGCGYGRLADCYKDNFRQVIMVDGSVSLLRQASQSTGEQAKYIACDVMHLPFKTASFDAVLLVRVFHHIQDSSAFLSELHRISCKDGYLVFNFMNKQNPRRIIRWLLGTNKDNPFDKGAGGNGSTLISHHPITIHQLLLEHNFSNIEYLGSGVMDKLVGKISSLGLLFTLAKSLAPFFGKSKFAPWIFCKALVRGSHIIRDAGNISDLLQCPLCRGNIINRAQGYKCLRCSREYPIIDGIIDMRV